jgi:D-glycero-alpha-D-manno-heptose 1-phosphate guanylyltransferase
MNRLYACILAGGLGTRLKQTIGRLPKALAPIAGRPFITYLLDNLANASVTHAILCTGYLADQIEAALTNNYRGIELSYSLEQSALGTGGALRNALAFVESDLFLVVNGDSLCSLNFHDFFTAHRARHAQASMALVSSPDCSRFGTVNIDKNSEILSFNEKGANHSAGVINAGIYLFDKSVIAAIPEGPSSLEYDLFPTLIGKGFYGFVGNGPFFDIGTPESLEETNQYFERKQLQRTQA